MKIMNLLKETRFSRQSLKNVLFYDPSTNGLWIKYDAGDNDIPLNRLQGVIGEAKSYMKEIIESINALGFDAKIGGKIILGISHRDVEEPYLALTMNLLSKNNKKIAQEVGIFKGT